MAGSKKAWMLCAWLRGLTRGTSQGPVEGLLAKANSLYRRPPIAPRGDRRRARQLSLAPWSTHLAINAASSSGSCWAEVDATLQFRPFCAICSQIFGMLICG